MIKEHIEKLIMVTLEWDNPQRYLVFILISGALGLTGFALSLQKISLPMAALTFIFLSGLPYLLLRSKLQVGRVTSSREGETVVNEILANYKISYYNMIETIERTAKTIEDAPNCKGLLFNLALGLNTAVSKEETNQLLGQFKYAIGTTWADILATNMYFAVVNGTKVTTSLHDLSQSLIGSRKLIEYSKRGHNEAKIMLKYLGPACMLLTVFGSIKFFGFTLEKYIAYQFFTAEGLTWFLLTVFFYIIGIVVSVFLTNRKLDL